MWTIQALQNQGAKVIFFTTTQMDWARYNRVYGTSVNPAMLISLTASRLPGIRNSAHLVHLQNAWYQRQCRRIARRRFDLLVSAYNQIDFGRPGIQLIGDYTGYEALRRELDPDADRNPRHRDHWLRRLYLAIGDQLRGDSARPPQSRGDLILANSSWTRGILEQFLGMNNCPVVFPPVLYQSPKGTEKERLPRQLNEFVCLGRICPEKRIESMIRILSRVREAGFPVTFAIAGACDDPKYGQEIDALVAENRDWIRLTGFLDATARDQLLATAYFGLHARPTEAFGIAVAELAGSGCIPFVPDVGGPAEIVDLPELQFRDEDDAVTKIIRVLSEPDHHEELRAGLCDSMARFRPEEFMRAFIAEAECFLKSSRDRSTFRQGSNPRPAGPVPAGVRG